VPWLTFSNPVLLLCILSLSPSTSLLATGGRTWRPSEESFHWPPCAAGLFREGREAENAQHLRKTQIQQIDFRQRWINRGLPTSQVLDLIRLQAPRVWELCYVVGKWVWIQFEQKQPRTVTAELAQLGFHWNRRRQVWQHPCGEFRTSTPRDPREFFPTFYPAD